MNFEINLGNVPFYWRIKKNINEPPNDIPNSLPFVFTYDSKYGLIRQKKNEDTLYF